MMFMGVKKNVIQGLNEVFFLISLRFKLNILKLSLNGTYIKL